MNKITGFNDIGYVAATFPVDATTISYLKTNHLNASTGNIDINGKNLAVKLGTDGKVGFGAATPTAADAFLGIIIAYEQDGYASVQLSGGRDNVPTSAAIATGIKPLAVNNKGEIVVLEATSSAAGGADVKVVKPATSDSKFASIYMN